MAWRQRGKSGGEKLTSNREIRMLESNKAPSSTLLRRFMLALLLTAGCSEPRQRPVPEPDASRKGSPEWTTIKARIRTTFPTVTEISTEQLARQLSADPSGTERTILLDARPEAEYAVSHLLGARRFETSLLADLAKDAPIVVYCSVGYRSAELARRLTELGYSRVRNLEGSLFEWANEGRPVYSTKGQVHKVHPYDREWGRLLDPSYR